MIKSDVVKKKAKIIFFYTDRFLRLYSNGDLAYFDPKTDELKTHIPFGYLKQANLEKEKIKFVTKNKTYVFKFRGAADARSW